MQFVFQALVEFIGTMAMPGPDWLGKKPAWFRIFWALGIVIVTVLAAALLIVLIAALVGIYRGLSS